MTPPESYTQARAIIEFAKNLVHSVIRNRGFPQCIMGAFRASRADLL